MLLFFQTALAQANTVVVKGYVRYANGAPAANRIVTISDSLASNSPCAQTRQKTTNANGFYIDTLTCSLAITRVRVYLYDCNTVTAIVHEHPVPTSGIVESNFTLSCNSPSPSGCEAAFTFTHPQNSLTFTFNSSNAHGVSGTTDAIVRRRWKFANGDTLGGNVVSPTYTFSQPGVYQTCLTIWTTSGCENTVCKIVSTHDSTAPSPSCSAAFSSAFDAVNYRKVKFNSNGSAAGLNDSIVSRLWVFGDGDSLRGNIVDPTHTYANDAIYYACLFIRTAKGCEKHICQFVEVRNRHCESKFTFERLPVTGNTTGSQIRFNSSTSTTGSPDSILYRIWQFGDGTTSVGNVVNPLHTFASPGNYTACLIIRTRGGCNDTSCVTINIPMQPQVTCKSRFTYVPTASTVQFNSSSSTTIIGDSIISRTWNFGDSTILTGNVINPVHHYAYPRLYTVCLTIRTAKGCESRECIQVVTTNVTSRCIPIFDYNRTSPKRVVFNSANSWTALNDTIIERKWDFGDGSPVLSGNVISPVKEYLNLGAYTVCLSIKTRSGCVNTYCNTVNLQDSIVAPNNTEPIRITKMYPSPASTQLNTVVWSLRNNVTAEFGIYDIYGVKKWSMSKILLQGNNYTSIPVAGLLAGPYFFRVTTMYGIKSRQFYKL